MPNQTFFNLPTEKQERILEISLKEFASNDYNSASMNNIIKNIGVAKGSFYRYFQNKNDLYMYLIDYAVKKRISHISENLNPATKDFNLFENLKDIILISLKFNLEHPIYSNFLYKNVELDFINGDKGSIKKATSIIQSYFDDAIKSNQNRNIVRDDISSDIILHTILVLVITIEKFIELQFNFKSEKNENKTYDEKKLKEIISSFVELFKSGLRAN